MLCLRKATSIQILCVCPSATGEASKRAPWHAGVDTKLFLQSLLENPRVGILSWIFFFENGGHRTKSLHLQHVCIHCDHPPCPPCLSSTFALFCACGRAASLCACVYVCVRGCRCCSFRLGNLHTLTTRCIPIRTDLVLALQDKDLSRGGAADEGLTPSFDTEPWATRQLGAFT